MARRAALTVALLLAPACRSPEAPPPGPAPVVATATATATATAGAAPTATPTPAGGDPCLPAPPPASAAVRADLRVIAGSDIPESQFERLGEAARANPSTYLDALHDLAIHATDAEIGDAHLEALFDLIASRDDRHARRVAQCAASRIDGALARARATSKDPAFIKRLEAQSSWVGRQARRHVRCDTGPCEAGELCLRHCCDPRLPCTPALPECASPAEARAACATGSATGSDWVCRCAP